ncbi:ASCH/PUA domain-containing protein [Aeromonas jandaei]
MIHELKIKPEYFAAVVSGDKTFEIRNNADRNFQVGDTLLLWEWDGGFTGQTVERTVSYITDFEQKPGYVVLGLANKREQELAEQLADATRQCGVMTELLREARTNVDQVRRWGRFDHDEGCGAEAALLLERIDALMAGQMLHHPEQPLDMVPHGWRLVPVEPTTQMLAAFVEAGGKAIRGYKAMLDAAPMSQGGEPLQSVSPPLNLLIKMTDIMKMCRAVLITAHPEIKDETGKRVIQYRIKLATEAINMAEHAIDVAQVNSGRVITEGQELELVTVLQSIVNGFSDDPAHDAAALLKRITGEVPWTGDSFQLPPRQGGEPCAFEPPSSSPA